MVQAISDFFSNNLPAELAVFIISMLPVLELRGGLIAASALRIPWARAALICIAGNILPVPFILLFIRAVLRWLGKTRLLGKLARHYEEKALRKGAELTEKYPRRIMLAVYLFVAIPLPMTGAWTGSLVAAFLGIPARRSFPAIALGVLTAACIMLLLAYAFPAAVGFAISR